MFYVYVLRSGKRGRRYVESCEDLDDRLRRHNAGESKATKHGILWTLLHAEQSGRLGTHPGQVKMNRMKFLLAMISVGLSVSAGMVCGQEPPLPTRTETPSPTPTATSGTRPRLNIPEISMSVEPPKLVPDSSPTIPSHPAVSALAKTAPALSELDAAFQKSPLAKEAEEYRLHVEWRQLQNRAAHDPEVVAAKAATTTAKTDLEKRARLRAYYDVYYAHMQALASSPEVRSYLDGKKAAVLEGLAQHRVRPTPAPQPSPAH